MSVSARARLPGMLKKRCCAGTCSGRVRRATKRRRKRKPRARPQQSQNPLSWDGLMMSDDDRTTPFGLFNYARSYWQSAVHLHQAAVKVTHPDAPITLLLAHAIELYIKGFLRLQGLSAEDLKASATTFASLSQKAKRAACVSMTRTRRSRPSLRSRSPSGDPVV